MSTSTRPRSALWVIFGVIIAAIGTAFGIYSWFVENQKKDIVTLQGLLLDQSSKPASVIKIWLSQDFNKSFDGLSGNGIFEIPNVKLPDNNKLGLVFQFRDSTIEEKYVDIPNPRNILDGVLSIGPIQVNSLIIEDNVIPEKEEENQNVHYLAYVDTKFDPLVLRDSPSRSGNKIGHIAKKEYVTVLGAVGEIIMIAGKKGKWCKIEHEGRTGYVFSAYLSPNIAITDS